MKPLPSILLTVVIVAVGILVYDTVRGDRPEPPTDDGRARETRDAEPRLGDTSLERLERRITLLEEQLEAQGRELAALLGETPASARDAEAGPVGGMAEATEPPPMSYDPETLASLKAHLLELQRRDREEAIRTQVEAHLERLGLGLDELQAKQIADAVVRYRADASKRWAEMEQEGRSDAAEMRKELLPLREAFVESVRPLLAPADLDRVVTQLIGGA